MKRKVGIVFVLGLFVLSPGASQADPTAGNGHTKDSDQFFASNLGAVTGGVVTVGSGAMVGSHRDIINTLEDAYKNDRVPYGGGGHGFIPGAYEPAGIAHQTLIDRDEKLIRLKKEIADLYREARRLDDFYLLQGFPSSSAVYKEGERLRGQAGKLTEAFNLRNNVIWDYYKNGAKGIYKGKDLSLNEINKIMALREKERLTWRQIMRDKIGKEKKGMIVQTIATVVGLFGTSYSLLEGAEASQRIEKAKAETQGGSNEAAQPQVVGTAAAR